MIFLCDNKRHLIALPYTESNLHSMAEILQIKKCWFHPGVYPHYDIPKKRIKEITQKCINITQRDLFNVIKVFNEYKLD